MDTKQLKNGLIIRLVVYVVLLIGAALVIVYLTRTNDEVTRKRDWLKNDIRSLNSKLEGLNKKTLEFSEAVQTWESMGESEQKLSGLRINDAKDVLDKLSTKYKLSEVNTSFSKPEELKNKFVADTVAVISSNVTISFKGLTDEYAMRFVEALIREFPGYIQIRTLSLTQMQEINKDVLRLIAKGEQPQIIKGNLDFFWRDLKYVGPEISDDGKEASTSAGGAS